MTVDPVLATEPYCYLTTTGRVTAKAHEIEIWFGLAGDTLYMLSGGRDRSDWVRNLMRTPVCSVRIAGQTFDGVARLVEPDTDEDTTARRLLLEKYQSSPTRTSSDDLTPWSLSSLPVAVELRAASA
jgi:deazaflavin-dependent oxidoreductase (nitroreductase family)